VPVSTTVASPRTEVRTTLEAVASRLFAERGYAATTVDAIVEGAGVSKPAFYRHFESKQHLHLELLERHRDQLATAALTVLETEADDLDSTLVAMLDAWFIQVESQPYTWRMMFRDTTGDPEAERVHDELRDRQRANDVMLLRRFAPGLPETELEPLGEVIRSSLTGLALWWLDHPATPRDVLVASMARVCRGLGLTVDASSAPIRRTVTSAGDPSNHEK
jgi:AcrR family transcriptional regulator